MTSSSTVSVKPKNIAIIGGGISGMSCGYLLSQQHQVSLFEAGNYIGGHTATKRVGVAGEEYAIDTGFIVFNDRTYPHFIRLLKTLGVEYQPTEMGFSVCDGATGYEYSGTSLSGVFAQWRNIFRPAHWRMLLEILRFNRQCTQLFHSAAIPPITLGEYLKQEGFGQFFCRYYILPMVSAIWSSGLDQAVQMPLVFFIRFFHNHGLLTVTQQPQWYTVKGGSQAYIAPLTKSFSDRIYLNCPVRSVSRKGDKVILVSDGLAEQEFDEVVFACHSDQALSLLADPSQSETEVLSAIPYLDNQVVLHTDTSILPNAKTAWASWNYRLATTGSGQADAQLTYNMKILQNLSAAQTFCVSMNPGDCIDASKVLGRYSYSHPLFTQASTEAQARWHEISGHNSTHFCGAYWRNGFHEDGLVSAIAVAKSLGINW